MRYLWCLLLLAGCTATPQADDGVFIRVNRVGYLPGDSKIAVLSSDAPMQGAFHVGEVVGEIGADAGSWGPFRHSYRLDFSALKEPGEYRVHAAGAVSPRFEVGPGVYAGAIAAMRGFLQLQRCGFNPVTGEHCHQEDGIDSASGEKVDLRGGWHDAGDGLKHMITTSWCVAALFLAGEEEEARWGADLLRRIHPAPEVLYVQIADDRDHAGWRLWHDDQADYGWGPGGARPGWRATGAPEGPKYKNASTGLASLAGRCAAALTLAGDLDAARSLYALARSRPGVAQSVPVKAAYHYMESTDRDDLEWAAVELYRATEEPAFLADALRFAAEAGDTSAVGAETHGHYELFPYVNLAHFRLHSLVDDAERARLAAWYRSGLEKVRLRAERNPYRLGTPLVWCSTNDVIAFATQALLYERMTGDTRYRTLATEARDWIFGRNPWGTSFLTGVPETGSASKVHHPFCDLSEHSPTGGLVDGPIDPAIHETFRRYIQIDHDPLARFQSEVAVYHDLVADFTTNEPILDGTVALLLLLRLAES